MKPWKTLRREVAFHHSKWLTVENHIIELPDGRVLNQWPWIIIPEFINVALIDTNGKFVCFRQTKYAAEGTTLAPVGGYLEAGEDPLEAAKRELREETGYEAVRWSSLGTFPVDGNHGAGKAHLFLATGGRKTAKTISDDLEEQELTLLTNGEVEQALWAGEFKVLSWSTLMAMALLKYPELMKP